MNDGRIWRGGKKSQQKKDEDRKRERCGEREMGSLSVAAHQHRAVSSQAGQHELPICQH